MIPIVLWTAAAAFPDALAAQRPDTTAFLRASAFVDVYYAYDFGGPRTLDRDYTTTAARHAEFNVNLAHLDVRLEGERLRGRLGIQVGTSVHANYANEPAVGVVSGSQLARFIQEATAGYLAHPRLWIDAGIFFAPFGSESWISADNWTYTRSLIADNSPYYQAGVKATWRATDQLSAQLHVINGWQNISETNSDKAVAARVDYAPAETFSVAYAAFAGNEQPDTARRAIRFFHELLVRMRPTSRLEVAATADYGAQQRSTLRNAGFWRGWSLVSRYHAAKATWLALRLEGYSDPEQIIVVTARPPGLRAQGASATIDVALRPALLWRFEARALRSPDQPFVDRHSASGFAAHNWAVISAVALRIG